MTRAILASLLLLCPALQANSAEIAWPQRKGTPPVRANAAPQPYNFAADMAARGEQSPVQLDLSFEKTDLVEVIDRFAFLLGDGTDAKQPVSYILHSGVKGEVTMQMQRSFPRRQAWGVFEHLLNSQGAHCIVRDGVLHILPMASAPRHPDSKPTFVKDPS
jgi:hypothetical protein